MFDRADRGGNCEKKNHTIRMINRPPILEITKIKRMIN